MKSFRAGGIDYPTSIAVDASTYGDVTTAVAVPASRREEVDILAEIHEAADENGVEFVPFKSKSSHFSKDDHQAFFSQLIDANKSRLAGLHFQHHSASRNQHYVEAVLTAILLDELRAELPTPWFALVDGDLNKVKTLAKACAGIGVDSPTLTHCYKSEWYYPHSLLADVSAGFLAWKLDTEKYDYSDPQFRVPAADRWRAEQWGKAFSFLQRKQQRSNYELLDTGTAIGNHETERMRIWYDGLMARGDPSPHSFSAATHVIATVEQMGYERLAERLRRL